MSGLQCDVETTSWRGRGAAGRFRGERGPAAGLALLPNSGVHGPPSATPRGRRAGLGRIPVRLAMAHMLLYTDPREEGGSKHVCPAVLGGHRGATAVDLRRDVRDGL